MTKSIVIYSKSYCPYCKSAKALLTQKGVTFTEYEISEDPIRTAEMIERAGGRRTVPQIFIGDVHVGGGDDIAKLNREGGLDPLLKPFLEGA